MRTALQPRSDLKWSAVERLFEVLADAVLLLDGRGALLYANPAAAPAARYTRFGVGGAARVDARTGRGRMAAARIAPPPRRP
jgi:hypothetical protein